MPRTKFFRLSRRLLSALAFAVVGLVCCVVVAGIAWGVAHLPHVARPGGSSYLDEFRDFARFLVPACAVIGFFMKAPNDRADGPALDMPRAGIDSADLVKPQALARKTSASRKKKLTKMTAKREARR